MSDEMAKNPRTIETRTFINLEFCPKILEEYSNGVFRKRISEMKTLKMYVAIGEAIVADEKYKTTNMYQLDCLLADPKAWMTSNFDEMNDYSTDRSFVAIAAPSMEGKTQSAFTLRQVKPLYFPVSEGRASEAYVSQAIYCNFKHLAIELANCAEFDLSAIRSNATSSDVTFSNLQKFHRTTPFWTIGYLKAFVDRSESDRSWMERFIEKSHFTFSPCTIAEVDPEYFSGFCLFLDEFTSKPWTDFLRNLAPLIGLRCVCSYTSADVARNHEDISSFTGSDGKIISSMVLVRLNPPSKRVLDELFGLQDSVNVIKRASDVESPIHRFLDDFIDNRLKYSCPGVAMYVAKAMKFYAESLDGKQATIGDFLDQVVFQLYVYMHYRKYSLKCFKYGILGKMGLLYPESYFPAKPGQALPNPNTNERREHKVPDFLKDSSFLNYHLYYLRNPQFTEVGDSRNWIFFTVFSEEKPGLGTLVQGQFAEWRQELTHFEPNDFFTLLGCLFIPYRESPMSLLSRARSEAIIENCGALSSKSDHLEVSTAICLIDASQHSNDHQQIPCRDELFDYPTLSGQRFSFHGQSGASFIQNLVGNFAEEPVSSLSDLLVNVTFSKSTQFDLVINFLNQCRIPFLYSVNRPIAILKNLCDSELFVEEFVNSAETDGRFPIRFNGQTSFAVVRYKFEQKPLKARDLQLILEETSIACAPKLSLVFCNSCTKTRASSNLVKLCNVEGRRINLFKVKKMGYRNYEIVPFFAQEDMICTDPEFVCIVFEMKVINPSELSNPEIIQKRRSSRIKNVSLKKNDIKQ